MVIKGDSKGAETLLVSVVICTHNRARYLRETIRSLASQTLRRECFEILVVDNASTDETRCTVLEELSHVKNIRYIYEPVLGLAHARNTGWRNAKGQYVAYLDDDGLACQTWVERIVEAFATVNPAPGCVGGRVDPIWESPPPAWISDDLASLLAVVNWSHRPIFLSGEQYLAGVNMAFPRALLAELDGFHPGVDRLGKKLLSNGDILIERLLEAKGYGIFYDPNILVRHFVPKLRTTKKWLLKRSYWQGVSDVVMDQVLHPVTRRSLLKSISRDAHDLVIVLTGGNHHFRKAYWHIVQLRFRDFAYCYFIFGKIKQEIGYALGLK